MRYYSLKNILKKQAQYNLIMSGRSGGKSTEMCSFLINEYKTQKRKFIRFFRRLSYTDGCETWFDLFNEPTIKDKTTQKDIPNPLYIDDKIEFDASQGVYLINGEVFGYIAVISLQSRRKGNVFDTDIYHTIFDEYIETSPDEYLDNEINKFMSLISTIYRGRTGQVWLLGNNLNEDSKYNPYHRYFGIDIDRDNIKQGQIKCYTSKKFNKPAKIAFEYGKMAYTTPEEVPLLQRIDGNEVATTGDFAKVWNIFSQKDEYKNPVSFYSKSIGNTYIKTDYEKCYMPIINIAKQSIDWILCDDPEKKESDIDLYNTMINYKDKYLKKMTMEQYNELLQNINPYIYCTPLYTNDTRYGANCNAFLLAINRRCTGFTFRYCDGNIKFIVENRILQDKHEY